MAVPAVTPDTKHPFWGTVAEALRGSHQDYTAGPLGRSILLLAVPMVLEVVLERWPAPSSSNAGGGS